MPTPEEQARKIIDQKLTAAGWVMQDFIAAWNRVQSAYFLLSTKMKI